MARTKFVQVKRWIIDCLPFLLISLMILMLAESTSQAQTGDRLEEALKTLYQMPTGEDLIRKALKRWNLTNVLDIMDSLKWGKVSRTDTILTRHYDPKTGLEDRERQVTVFLRENQPDVELILDLAHELVHAVARPTFDPYDSTLTPGKYILAAIEGDGGEVDAVFTECKVALELSKSKGIVVERCGNYLHLGNDRGLKGVVDREKIRGDFYRVGKWYSSLLPRLGEDVRLFPLLSSDAPKLYSSTGHAPYPIALLKEFEEITEMACDNSRKRMSVSAPESNSPVVNDRAQHPDQKDVWSFIQKRCK